MLIILGTYKVYNKGLCIHRCSLLVITGMKRILYTVMVKNIGMVILLQIIYIIFHSKRKKFCQSFFLEFSVLCTGINLFTNKYNLEV